MEATMKLSTISNDVKEKLVSISQPKNPILARLQSRLGGQKDKNIVCSYSRMHNRHNRG